MLDGIAYADSYLAQRIRLPRAPGADRDVIVIGLDTNQAGPLASGWDTVMGRSPGDRGHIHPDQIAAVEKWVDDKLTGAGMLSLYAASHGKIVMRARAAIPGGTLDPNASKICDSASHPTGDA